jgi:putative tryptophan/tyrosine transport system substrate-binding protein
MNAFLIQIIVIFIVAVSTAPVRAENIAVVLSSDAGVYREALEGFREVVRHRIAGVQTLKTNPADQRDELKKLRSVLEPDLVFVIGTPALQTISREITNIPIVHALVFNPLGSVPSASKNVVGVSMIPSTNQVASLIRELNPKYRRVGTMFDPSRSAALFRQARMDFEQAGLQLVALEIRSAGEVGGALKSLEKDIDILWLWPDEAYLADDILQRIFLFSFDRKIPVLGLSERHTQMGALLSIAYGSAKDMGRQAAEVINRLLEEGRTTGAAQITPRQTKFTVNLKTARKLEVKIPEGLVQRAGNAIKAPVYKNGDWWTFRTRKIYANGKSEVEDHRVTFNNGSFQSDNTSFLRGEDIATAPSFLPFATVHLADPARKWLDFPLLPGKTWSFQYRRRSFAMESDLKPRFFGGSRTFTWVEANAEVAGYKSVVTPAGKFDAIEISRWDVLNRPVNLTYLYSPLSKSVIKLETDIEFRDSETGATRFELELIAYGNEANVKTSSR